MYKFVTLYRGRRDIIERLVMMSKEELGERYHIKASPFLYESA